MRLQLVLPVLFSLVRASDKVMDKNRRAKIVNLGEGPSPTDEAFKAANHAVAEERPSNRKLLHNYVHEVKVQNPEMESHPSLDWINSYIQESDISDQNQTLA